MTKETVNRDEDETGPETDNLRLVLPVVTNPRPLALVVHCADIRFRMAFRRFVEGDKAQGCLGFTEDEHVNLVIPGGMTPFADPLALPKHFKVAREQIEFLLDHFPTIETVILINHEDCAAYQALSQKIGAVFIQRFSTMLQRQQIDLKSAAKAILGFKAPNLKIRLFLAKFANPEHTQVNFEELTF